MSGQGTVALRLVGADVLRTDGLERGGAIGLADGVLQDVREAREIDLSG